MRRLILQMQISVDGYVAADDPQLDWQVWNWGPEPTWDADLFEDFQTVFASVGTILLSRPMVEEGYLDHWARMAAAQPSWTFARRIGEVDKVVATSKPFEPSRPRTVVDERDLTETVQSLKRERGGDIIAFGGVTFASALVERNLIDEFQLFVNPAAVGAGGRVFASGHRLTLTSSRSYPCGIVVNRYRPAGNSVRDAHHPHANPRPVLR